MGSTPTKTAIIGTYINGRNSTNDFLQLAVDNGGNVFAWIDANGVLWGFNTTQNSSYAVNFTSQTSVTITGATHGLNTADIVVSVYDSGTGTRNLIIPNSVSIDSTTFNVTVTFQNSQSGRIILVS
jgi:hypothetical protein